MIEMDLCMSFKREARGMNSNYAILTDVNKMIADAFIDFLLSKQENREEKILASLKEYDDGQAIGPFNSVDELMEDLYA